jgi:hypothetical protein
MPWHKPGEKDEEVVEKSDHVSNLKFKAKNLKLLWI